MIAILTCVVSIVMQNRKVHFNEGLVPNHFMSIATLEILLDVRKKSK